MTNEEPEGSGRGRGGLVRRKPAWALVLRAQIQAGASELRAIGARRPPQQTRFVVLSHGRSGSTLLVDLIAGHPDVHCDREILSHRLFVTSAARYVRRRAMLFPSSAYGFKLRPTHFAVQGIADPLAFMHDLHRDDWRLVHLVRRNVVRTALSILRMRQTGVVHQRGQHPSDPRTTKVRAEPDALLATIARVELEQATEAACLTGIPHLSLSYEDDLLQEATRQEALDRVFGHLGLPRAQVSTNIVKLTGDHLPDVIENYAEVAARLAGTRYEPLLDRP